MFVGASLLEHVVKFTLFLRNEGEQQENCITRLSFFSLEQDCRLLPNTDTTLPGRDVAKLKAFDQTPEK